MVGVWPPNDMLGIGQYKWRVDDMYDKIRGV